MIFPAEEDWVKIHVKVSVSNQFFGWIFGLGEGIRIIGPENVVEKMKHQLNVLKEKYS